MSREDAEDADIDVIIRLGDYRDRLDNVANIGGFITNLCANVAADRKRRNRDISFSELGTDPETMSQGSSASRDSDLGIDLMAILKTLPTREREIIQLTTIEGSSLREAAAAMNITLARASQIHGQALTRLRKEFGVS